MRFKLLTSLSIAFVACSLLTTSAKACESGADCSWKHKISHKKLAKHSSARQLATHTSTTRHRVRYTISAYHWVRHTPSARHLVRQEARVVADRGPVVAMIKAQAPSFGVPTWFALRIAKVESGFNPRARGLAGEYGVFQLKCATARGLGFTGNCAGLLNASTNIRYGLKHLSLAVRSSHGNLRMAASMHNGGLGRRSLVPRYVAMVF